MNVLKTVHVIILKNRKRKMYTDRQTDRHMGIQCLINSSLDKKMSESNCIFVLFTNNDFYPEWFSG